MSPFPCRCVFVGNFSIKNDQQEFGKEHIPTIFAIENVKFDRYKAYQKAEEFLNKALHIRVQGQYDEAEEFLMKALNIRLNPNEHSPDVALSSNSLEPLYKKKGDFNIGRL